MARPQLEACVAIPAPKTGIFFTGFALMLSSKSPIQPVMAREGEEEGGSFRAFNKIATVQPNIICHRMRWFTQIRGLITQYKRFLCNKSAQICVICGNFQKNIHALNSNIKSIIRNSTDLRIYFIPWWSWSWPIFCLRNAFLQNKRQEGGCQYSLLQSGYVW